MRKIEKVTDLSFVMAVLVMYIHSYTTHVADCMRFSAAWWVQEFISQGFARIAVPYFLVVFAYFLGRQLDGVSSFGEFMCKVLNRRIKTLLLPYVLWCVLGVAFAYVYSRGAPLHPIEVGKWAWWCRTFGVSGDPLYMFHLWFVKWILLVSVISVPLHFVCRRFPFISLIVTALWGCFSSNDVYMLGQGAFFVVVGFVVPDLCGRLEELVGNRHLKACETLAAVWGCLILLKQILYSLGYCDVEGLICGRFNLLFIANVVGVAFAWMIYDVFHVAVENKYVAVLRVMTPFSFFIYCAHTMVLRCVKVSMMRMFARCSPEVLSYLVAPLITTVVIAFIAFVLKRRCNRLYLLLSGGR